MTVKIVRLCYMAWGEQQLEIVQSMLLEKYKVEIELMRPKVAFRETIRGKSDVEYKYKKQSGGHGQYGHVKMKFEPSNVFSFHTLFIKCLEIREIYNGIDVKNENFQRILLIFTENILRRRTISRVMSLGDHLSSTIVANRLKRPT